MDETIGEKIKFFGEFNLGRDSLLRAQQQLLLLWNDGTLRLKIDDIDDISKTQREIKGILKQIDGIKELFNGITNNKIEEK